MPTVLSPDTLPHPQGQRLSTNELLGKVADISGPGGLEHLRIHHEELPPGHRSSAKHSHTSREEFVYVLAGSLVVESGAATVRVEEGQCICLPASGPAHVWRNQSSEPALLLVVSASLGADTIVYAD